jgi:RNA polymerase sigma factor (sigma-70 family)
VELAIRARGMTSIQETDERLLSRLAHGDVGALESLYERHARAIFAFLCRLIGDAPIAEELLQETFLAAWHSSATFQGRSSVRTWLFGIAHNKAGHWLRRRRPQPLDEHQDIPDPSPSVSELADAAWEQDRVMAALSQLPATQRAVLELTFYHGLAYAEIAEILDCPVGTVKSRAYLARRRLAQLLAELADPTDRREKDDER